VVQIDAEAFTDMVRPLVLSNRNYSKVFGIGANKTGTTTLEAVLSLYGLHMPNQALQEALTTKQTFLGNYEPLRRLVAAHDAFQDLPFSQRAVYVAADCLFPNSKFILTERDPEQWFASLCRATKAQWGLDSLEGLTEADLLNKFSYLYPGYLKEAYEGLMVSFAGGEPVVRWDLVFDADYRIGEYIRRNEAVKQYFFGRESDLLVINISEEKTTARICTFLNIPLNYSIDMPHLNKSQ
jgi:hypothetical protein